MHYNKIGQVSITDDKYLLPSTKSGWVEPASPMELITSPIEAPQARWPNPFSNHVPEMNSKPYLSVVAHVFSYLGYFMTRTRWCGQKEVACQLTRRRTSRSVPHQRSLFVRDVPVYKKGIVVGPQLVQSLRVSRVKFTECSHCQRPLASFCRWVVLAMSRVDRAELNAPLPGRPYSLYATIFYTANEDKTDSLVRSAGGPKSRRTQSIA